MRENQTQVTEFVLVGFSAFPDLQGVLFVVFLFMYLMTLAGNLAIMAVIWTDRHLHTPMYLYLGALSFSETCYTFVIIPKALVDLVSEGRIISLTGCVAQMFFFLGLGSTNCAILIVMGYDRYLAICHPLRYGRLMSLHVFVKLVVGSWISGFLVSLVETTLIFQSPFCRSNIINHFFCHMRPVLSLACIDSSTIEVAVSMISMLGLSGSFLLIVLTYLLILGTIVQLPSASGKREKAFSTCAAHLTVVVMHFGFASIIYLKPSPRGSMEEDTLMSVPYTILTPFLSPMIFTLRNKEMKIALRKAFGKRIFS
ncbi:olfactory receptor 10X1 [Alligator mississippiensis]|uniref:olfactory receptor 10X1 n=1 Tax=Alligator mississippiensis TaxID=8496 RepID=UPI0028777D21|nr:olfactory receptor 10X1 [Alligator mississippiensis]